MNLDRGFTWCAGVLVMLAIGAFCLADANLALAAFALPVGLAAWVLASRAANPLRLPRRAVNLLLIGIVLLAVVWVRREVSVSAIATIAVYILLLKIGDRRGPRDDGQILALAVFLLIAAMLTSSSLVVGVLLAASGPALVLGTMLLQLRAGLISARQRGEGASPGPPPREWTADARAPRLGMTTTASVFLILGSAVFVFLIMPRGVGEGFFGGFARRAGGSVTGFSNVVQLGTRGVISESPTVVMEVEVRQAASTSDTTGVSIGSVSEVLYLRGAVLEQYDNGLWSARVGAGRGIAVEANSMAVFGEISAGSLVRQDVRVRDTPPAGTPATFFGLWRPVAIQLAEAPVERDRVRVGDRVPREREPLVLGPGRTLTAKMNTGPFAYTIWSLPTDGLGSEPMGRSGRAGWDSEAIAAEARRVLRAAGIEPDPASRPVEDDAGAARAIQSWLRTNFAYTLEEAGRPSGVDPIEHFLFTTKRGHCEYFAAAMVAMCRSIGIGARMVTGYLAADFNAGTGTYTVRESNAHAWAEVEVGTGRWRVFDATPPDDIARIHRASPGLAGRVRQMLDLLDHLWNRSVVSFDERDRAGLFGRTGRRGGPIFGTYGEGSGRRTALGLPPAIFRGVLAGAAVFAFVTAIGLAIAWVVRRLGVSRDDRPNDPAVLGFYGELLGVLARRGVRKPAWRPPAMHAQLIAGADPEAASVTRDVVRDYYRSRFGGEALTRAEREAARRCVASIRRRR